MTELSSDVVIYQTEGGGVEVRLEQDSVWLTQRQMAGVFETTPENVLMHLRNIFGDGELDEQATTKEYLAVQTEGKRKVKRRLKGYNLDAVISVGYRVNSKRAVAFRQWATTVLSQHLTQGYTLNRQRLENNARELEAALQLVRKLAQNPELPQDAGRGLLDVVTRYARTFLLLQRYDEGLLTDPPQQSGGSLPSLHEARESLARLKTKAAHLLYFVIKNHPFADGNKRSGAFLFVDFLARNKRLLDAEGQPVINDIGLAALALLIAESDPRQKETLIRLVMNMLAHPGPSP